MVKDKPKWSVEAIRIAFLQEEGKKEIEAEKLRLLENLDRVANGKAEIPAPYGPCTAQELWDYINKTKLQQAKENPAQQSISKETHSNLTSQASVTNTKRKIGYIETVQTVESPSRKRRIDSRKKPSTTHVQYDENQQRVILEMFSIAFEKLRKGYLDTNNLLPSSQGRLDGYIDHERNRSSYAKQTPEGHEIMKRKGHFLGSQPEPLQSLYISEEEAEEQVARDTEKAVANSTSLTQQKQDCLKSLSIRAQTENMSIEDFAKASGYESSTAYVNHIMKNRSKPHEFVGEPGLEEFHDLYRETLNCGLQALATVNQKSVAEVVREIKQSPLDPEQWVEAQVKSVTLEDMMEKEELPEGEGNLSESEKRERRQAWRSRQYRRWKRLSALLFEAEEWDSMLEVAKAQGAKMVENKYSSLIGYEI